MKSRPIIFSAPMVNAILAGTKTQHRSVVKPQPTATRGSKRPWCSVEDMLAHCPYGAPGDQLWLREAWKTCAPYDAYSPAQIDSAAAVQWLADGAKRLNGPEEWGRYRHAHFMPRWASRITLEITDVRVERLAAISEEDADAEGVEEMDGAWPDENLLYVRAKSMGRVATDSSVWYAEWWDMTNAKRGYPWASNPFVWVRTLKRVAQEPAG